MQLPSHGAGRATGAPRGQRARRALWHHSGRAAATAVDAGALTGVALFFTPGALLAAYSVYRGNGNFADGFSRVITELSQGYFNPNAGGATVPVCEGELSDLAGGDPLFVPLQRWANELGGVFKLAFGPKCFLVVSDPIVARHLLRENAMGFDKGMLGEILSEIMGKGLIPADNETWKVSTSRPAAPRPPALPRPAQARSAPLFYCSRADSANHALASPPSPRSRPLLAAAACGRPRLPQGVPRELR